MLIKTKLVDGTIMMQQRSDYQLAAVGNMHPDILEATVYTDQGRKIVKVKRRHQKRYIKHEYKPLPEVKQEPEGPTEDNAQ